MMVEINPVPIICQARRTKRPITFSFHELEYVIRSSFIDNNEKLIWWLIGVEANNDPQLACLLSYQHITYTLQMDNLSVHRALYRLVRMGFLQVSGLPPREQTTFTLDDLMIMRLFMLTLPYEGLLTLKKAPNYQSSLSYQQGIFRKSPLSFNLLKKKDDK